MLHDGEMITIYKAEECQHMIKTAASWLRAVYEPVKNKK